ncbi:MAG: hypothetical protein E7417_00220 [Ruminococcaceae bacterium]|nr:hypothetical protein [Oscillospiraceae bacterium]
MKTTTIFTIFILSLCIGTTATYGDFSWLCDTVVYAPSGGGGVLPLSDAPGVKDGMVNINTANADELDLLYGIGQAYANRIIDYRKNNGRFEVIQDIMKVTGIGEKRFSRIKDNITVE